MKFKNDKYEIIKNAISEGQARFLFNYLVLKHNAIAKMTADKWLPERIMDSATGCQYPLTGYHSNSNDQVPGAYNIYGDHAMETLLIQLLSITAKITGLDLIPCYSFTRLYKKGNKLTRHKDRSSCEISTTLHLGGEVWPLYLKKKRSKEISILLTPGDMLIYKGAELEHWRKPLTGSLCGQAFLHYNDKSGPFGTTNMLDRRPVLGYPFKGVAYG